MTFGERLRIRRKAQGMTQAVLARTINASRQQVSAWEKGDYHPRSELIPIIAKVLGMKAERLAELIVRGAK